MMASSAMYGGQELIEDRSRCRAQIGCLCGTSSCRFCCRFCPSIFESTSTRLVYILFLFMSVAVMALMMSLHVQKAIMSLFPNNETLCVSIGARTGEECEEVLGYMGVYRLGLAITAYHFLLMLMTCGVKSSRDCRAGLHNGMWFYKTLVLICLYFGSFFIPNTDRLFISVWMYTAMGGAALFIVIQLLLLVFLYHSWTDKLAARVEGGGSSLRWYGGPKDVRLRLLHSSLVCLYVIYLTWSALGSAPREHKEYNKTSLEVWIGPGHNVHSESLVPQNIYYCGPEALDSMVDKMLPYVTLVITFLTVTYSVVGTASPRNCKAIKFPSCPSQQSVQRHNVEDTGGQKVIRNEASGLAYSYSLFHVMMGLATLFLMMSLTDWNTPSSAKLMTFGRSWSAVWIKIISSWVCLALYLVVTLFPTMLPNSNYRTAPANVTMVNGYGGSLRGSRHSLDDEAAVPLTPSKQTATVHQETTV